MTDLTDVLHLATDDLAPRSPDDLLERAVRRGERLRRRRQALGATTTVAGVAAAGVAAVLLLGGPGDHAAPPQPLRSGPASAPAAPSPGPVRVAVDRDAVGATFARIVPGRITEEHDTPAGRVYEKDGYASDFLWNGSYVSVRLAPGGHDSRAACRALTRGSLGTQTCVRVRGGWSLHDSTMGDQDYSRWVVVELDNGFHVWVMINNSSGDKGSSDGGPPPLDVPDLERVATSRLWFAPASPRG